MSWQRKHVSPVPLPAKKQQRMLTVNQMTFVTGLGIFSGVELTFRKFSTADVSDAAAVVAGLKHSRIVLVARKIGETSPAQLAALGGDVLFYQCTVRVLAFWPLRADEELKTNTR